MINSNDRTRRARGAGAISRSLLCGASLAALIALGAPSTARAQDQDRYWDANGTNPGSGGTGTWDTSSPVWSQANSDVLGPYQAWNNAALDNAIFGITATGTTTTAGTVTLAAPVTVHNMTFQTVNGWILSGSTLTLGGTAPTLTVNGDTTINSILAGTAGLNKVGSRTLTLNGANTFSGGITLGGGALVAANDAALGAAGNNIAVTTSSTLGIQAGTTSRTVNIASGATLSIQGVGSGSALYTGAGNLNVSANGGIHLTNNASTYTGTTRFNGCNGVCSAYFSSIGNLGEASSLGAPTDAVSGTILFAQSSQYSDSVVYVGDGDSSNRNWNLQGSAAVIRNQGTGTLTITGNVVTNGSGNYSAENADFQLLGTLSGASYAFAGVAGHTITLGGANDYTGTTGIGVVTVKAPVLADMGVNSSLGAGTGAIAISSNGTLSYTGAGASSNRPWSIANTSGGIANDGTGALSLSGAVTLGPSAGGTFTLGGSFAGANTLSGDISGTGNIVSTGSGTWTLSGANSFTGSVTVNGGTLQAGSATAFGTSTGMTVNGGTLDLNSFSFTAPTLNGTGGTVALGAGGTLTVNGTAASSYAGAITGGGNLVKMGSGTLTLSGASSFTGGTTLVGGTLALDFSGAGGPVSDILANGSTLNVSGGTLKLTGAGGEANSQSFGAVNVTAGSNTLRADSASGGSVALNLGAINRSGGLVNFVLPATGAITTTNADGQLGGWATINGTDYAKVVSGNITAFTAADYTTKDNAGTWQNGDIISDDDANAESFFGTVASSIQIGGLKYSVPDATTTVTIAAGQTLGIDGTILVAPSVAANNQLITGGSLTGGAGGGTLGVQQNGGGIFTIASTIVDNGGSTGFAKGGSGTVQLTGANSYTGGTTLSGGRLEVNSLANGGVASSIGASSADPSNLVLESGTLAYIGGTDVVSDRGFTLVNGGAGAPTIEVNAGRSVEFSGQVVSSDDAGLTKTGWGTLVLSNPGNNYVGVTTISGSGAGGASTLSVNTLANGGVVSGIGAASNASTNLVLDAGGRLQYTGGTVAIDRGFSLTNGGGRIDVSQAATTLTVSGIAVGTGQFTKEGAGTLILSGVNTYTGGTHVTGGMLVAGSTQAFGGAAGGTGVGALTVDAAATVDLANNSNFVGGLNGAGNVLLGSATLNINSSGTFSGTISGTGGLSITRFTQTMSGCSNNYTGPTVIVSGLTTDCLANGGVASGIGASGSSPTNLALNGGSLNYTGGSVAIDRGFSTSSGQINVTNAATTLTITGATTGGQFTKEGAGTLVLSGTTSRTGGTQVNNGTLRAGAANAFGTGGVGFANAAGAVLDLNGFDTTVAFLNVGGATGGNVTLGGATLTVGAGNGNYAGAISGPGNFTKNSSGTQTLASCASSYDGITTISGGVLAVNCLTAGGANSSIGASSSNAANLVIDGGTLRYLGTGDSTDRQFTLGTTGGRLDASGTGTIAFTSTAAITLAGTGNRTLTLAGTNSGDNILAAQITNPGTGTTSLTKTDTGTWRLTNQASNYTGATTISGGVLSVDKLANGGLASSIGMATNAATNLVIGSGGTLRYTGTGDTTDRRFTLGVGTTAIESSGSGAIVFTDTGAISYSGNGARVVSLGGTNTDNNVMGASIGNQNATVLTSLAKNDAGRWILTGNNSYTGVTNINAGTLILGDGGTTGSIASGTVNNFGLLGFNRSDSSTYAGVIQGTGSVSQAGSGTTILTGNSSYTGGTTISAGTLQLGNGGTSGSIVGNIVDDGTLAFNRSDNIAYAGVISGAGSVRQTGPGVLTLSGANTYLDGTTINGGGTLQISSDANLGDAGGAITFNNGTLQLLSSVTSARNVILTGAGTFNSVGGSDWTVTGNVSGAGSLTVSGNSGTLILTGDATHTGGTTVNTGSILQIGNAGTTGSLAGDVVDNGFVDFNRSDSYTYSGAISGSGSVSVTGGIITLAGNSSYGGGTSISGDGELRVTAANTVASGGTTSVNHGTLTVSGAGSTFEAGQVTAVTPTGSAIINVQDGGILRTTAGGMALRGAGTPSAVGLNVSGAGSLVDLAGALTVANSTASTAGLSISGGGSLRSTGANVIGGSTGNTVAPIATITGAGSSWTSTGSLAMTDGSLSLLAGGAASFATATIGSVSAAQPASVLVSGADSNLTTTGDLVIGSGAGTGVLTLGDGGRMNVGGVFVLADSATATGVLNIGGAEGQPATAAGVFDATSVNLGSTTSRVNFNHTDAGYTFAAEITGSGSVNQVAGTTILTGANSYGGATNINGGTLRINGNQSGATGLVTVANGATLGGSGTIGGSVLVQNGGTLAPGNSPGTLTINSNLALSSGSILNFEFGQANTVGGPLNDLVNVGGNLTLDGTINVTVPTGGTFGGGIYRVFNYAGTLTDNGLDLGTMPGGSNVAVQTSIAGQVNLVNSAGLALSFWDGDAGPKLNGVVDGGNGTWHLAGTDNNWTDMAGAANAAYADGTMAIFAGTAGTVTIDNGNGAVTASGMQFATDGYLVQGAPLTLVGTTATIRVGDGTPAGAGYTATMDAVLAGTAALNKTDLGRLILTGTNSYSGGTTITAGALQIGNGGTSGSILGNVANNGQLIFDRTDPFTFSGLVSGSGALVQAGTGTTILTAANSYTGGTTISAGTLQLGNGGTTGMISGNVTDNGTLAFNRADDIAFAGIISGTGALRKDGADTLTLSGANSYTGATTVNAGTLIVNGNQSGATGTTTVNAATLGGIGTIGGNVAIASGSTLNPGGPDNLPATMTINGALAIASGAQLAVQFGQPGVVGGPLNDLITVGGNVALGGTLNVNASAGGSFDPGVYRVINYGGALTDNGMVIGSMPSGTDFHIQKSVAGQVNLVNSSGLALRFWDGDAGARNDGFISGGSGTWQGTGGNDNWTLEDGSVNAPFLDSAFAVFQGASGIVTADGTQGAINVAGMQFATSGYQIVGAPINLVGSQAVIRVGDGSAASSGYVATIGAALTGSAQLVKTDAGTLILGGTNSYSGGTAINGGTLQISSDANLGAATGGLSFNAGTLHNTAVVNSNRAVTLAGTGTIVTDASLTMNGVISGAGNLVKGGGSTLILGGVSTYTGGTTVVGGMVQVSSDANLGAVAGTLSLQGGTLQAGASFTSARTMLLGSFNANSIDTQGFDMTLGGAIGDGPNNSSGDFLNKLGTGTLTLAGANTYSNRTIIAGGTLALAGNGTIGAGNLVVGSGTVFDISQANVGARVIQLNGAANGTIALGSKTLTLGFGSSFTDWAGTITDGGIAGGTGGRVVISAPNGAVRYFNATSYTGGTTVAAGSFELVGNGALYSGGAVAVNGGALFNITGLTGAGTTIGDLSGAGAVALGAKSLTLGTANSTAFSGTISGAGGSIVKNGSGKFTLSGANSYTGATTVNAGTLIVNGNQSAATGLTSVLNGATLGGSGTIGGNVTVANGGILAPGNSPGTLTINGNLSLSAGSILNFEFGQANTVGGALNDLVNVGGNLTLDGTLNVSAPTGGTFGAGIYRVFNYAGTLTDNGLALGTLPAGNAVTVQTSVAGQVNLINQGNLTLNFWDGDAGPKFNNAVNGGNGTWQATITGDNWTDAGGAVNAAYANDSFAVFAGAAGTVTVDNTAGAISASGMQFATSGYLLQGDPLTLTGTTADVRVGDGTNAGAAYVATVASTLTGTAALNKTDLGTLILTGTNDYSGGTIISGGTLQLGNGGATGTILGDVTDNGTLAFNHGADMSFGGAVSGSGSLVKQGTNVLTLTGDGSYTGGTTIQGGTLRLGDGGTAGSIVGNVIDNGALSFNRSDDVAFAGLISGTGALSQEGPGALTLSGANSYAGPTTVNAGALFINGDQSAATGLTMVNGGATLGGTGTIGGEVRVADGGALNPGGVDGLPGTLTIKGGLSLAAGSSVNVALGQANTVGGALNDLVNVGGNLVLDGTLNVSVPTGGAFDAGIYRLFNYGGALTDNGLALGTLPAGSTVTVQTAVAGQVNLLNTAGLTLNFWDGDAGPKFNNAVDGGNGTWQAAATADNWTDANGTVNAAYANGAFAVFAGKAGTVAIDNSQGDVSAAGLQFATDGYTLQGDALTLVGPQSTVRVGDGTAAGAAFTATIASAVTGTAQLVKTDLGTLILSGTNSYAGGTAINGGTLVVSTDANLGDAAGGVGLDGGMLRTTASITSGRSFSLGGNGTILTDQDTTLSLGGAFSGSGVLTKDGAGTLVLAGDSSGYVADTHVARGTLAVDGAWGSNVDVAAAARLEGVGRVGGIANAGVVAPGRAGFGTLTVTGNYVGNGGTLEIETALGDDASPTDRLVVNGATSGTTGVTLINRNGLGAQTAEGIKIIDVVGASNGTFTLNGDYQFQGAPAVVAGAYAYRLYKNGVTDPNDGDWYLRSALTNPPTDPNSGEPPVTPPLYQPGVPVYEGYAQTLLALTGLPTLQERVGNRSWAGQPTQGGTGIWGRMEGARHRPQPVSSTSDTDKNIDSWQAQIGLDHTLAQRSDGATLVGAITAQYGKANTGVTSIFGNGAIAAEGYGVGATLTWYGPKGFYVDGQAQVAWFSSDLKSGVLGSLASGNHGMGEAFSLEVGKRTPVGGKLSVTPQIQMAFAHANFDRFTDPSGAVVSPDQGRSLKTRWGLSIDHQDSWSTGSGGNRSSHVYAIVNLNYEWLPESGVKVSGTPITNREQALWGELGLGGSYSWNDRITLYAQASAETAVADFGNGYSMKGTAGVRIRF